MKVPHTRPPRWIKIRPKSGEGYVRVRSILKEHGLHSVCQEAACPNIRECYGEGTATFMILGEKCTRGCNFCDVIKGKPDGLDTDEPRRLAEVVAKLNLKQVVITSVTRDDLPDGGADIFVNVMKELRARDKEVKVEFLISDLAGNKEALGAIIESGVDVLGHNVETVGRLHKRVRGAAKLARSLEMLKYMSDYTPRPVVKTGLMVGLGETVEEVIELLHQVKDAGVDIVTIGQYLRPSLAHLPVERFYRPEEFEDLTRIGMEMGFGHVEAGPLVRSSYKAFNQSKGLLPGHD
ncbi:MAG: lipoyl synthase [candidate division Zixibacteria bacterium]|nr:lipoyl synthase [candidate division Zixibacteria bacterium]